MADTHISIPLGIIIGLLASFVQSLGLTIQRKSHVLNQVLPEHEQRVEHRRPLWLLGFAIFISSNILGSLVQIASLPVVILAPLGAVSLLWNAFFAKFLLGDVFSPWMILGTLLIAGGAVLIAVFGIVPEPTRSLEDLLELFRRPTFVLYFSLLGAVVVVCLAITHITEFSLSRRMKGTYTPGTGTPTTPSTATLHMAEDPSALTTGVTDTIAEATVTERTPLIDSKLRPPSRSPSFSSPKHAQDLSMPAIVRTRLFLALSYASFSGILSGMCLLFAKSGVELLLLTLRGKNQFWRWEAWMLVLGLLVFALLQLWYLHKALILANPTLVCPSAFCFYNLSSIVNGLVYFDQFALIPPLHLELVVLGIIVLLGGVWVVSIQSGGGEIDLETWDAEHEELTDDDLCVEDAEGQDVEFVSRMPIATTGTTGQGPVSIPDSVDWGTRSEPNIGTLSTSPDTLGLGLNMASERPLSPVSHSDLRPSSTSPSRVRSRPSHVRYPTSDSHHASPRHSRRVSSHTQSNSHIYSPPPINTHSSISSLAGAGLQIGLSPVSPGFSILPLERRRRVSNLGPHAETEVDAVGDLERERRRRTVSEGDVRRQALALAQSRRAGVGEDGESGADVRELEDSQDVEAGTGRGRPQKKKWKWLKRFTTGR